MSEDNQQVKDTEMVTELELAWLAGFWDGEGFITIFSHQEANGQRKICPTIGAVNTHEGTIAYVTDILDRLETSFQIQHIAGNEKHKSAYHVKTRNMAYIEKTLAALLPYLVTKRPQAQLTLRYVRKKLEQRKTNGCPRYDADDFSTQRQVQAMNKKGPVSESSTTKGPEPVKRAMI